MLVRIETNDGYKIVGEVVGTTITYIAYTNPIDKDAYLSDYVAIKKRYVKSTWNPTWREAGNYDVVLIKKSEINKTNILTDDEDQEDLPEGFRLGERVDLDNLH